MMKAMREDDIFDLENFTGPLKFLLQLIRRDEVDVRAISLKQITQQYLEKLQALETREIQSGADFVGMAATLLWTKSQMLLPGKNPLWGSEDDVADDDPEMSIIEKIVEFYHLKEKGKKLAEREQGGHYGRDVAPPETKSFLDTGALTLENLLSLYQDVIKRMEERPPQLSVQEEWTVGDKIDFFREMLSQRETLSLRKVFLAIRSKEEVIVTFLALLELMKQGELIVKRGVDDYKICRT